MSTKRFSEETVLRLKNALVGKFIYRRRSFKHGVYEKIGHCLGEIRSISSDGMIYLYNSDYNEHSKITISELKEESGANYVITKRYIQ